MIFLLLTQGLLVSASLYGQVTDEQTKLSNWWRKL